MQDFFFAVEDESDTDGRFTSTPATVGPWSAQAQHGGPPSALLVRCAERAVRISTRREDLAARRYAADFVGPVPVGELRAQSRIVRAARSAALVETTLSVGDRVCLGARIWFVARVASPASPGGRREPPDIPALTHWSFPYAEHLEWRMAAGSPFIPGPAAAWVRPRVPLIAGEELSGLQRAVLIGDSASGVSSALSWQDWSFANVDLDLHLARDVDGEWLLMDAETVVGPDGTAVARSVLSDLSGTLGGSLQTLIIRRTSAHSTT